MLVLANTQLSDATHIMVYIALHDDKNLKSDRIASSLNTDATLVRRIMGKLKKHGLLVSTRGVARPTIAHDVRQITLKDIYLAVTTKRNLLNVDTNTSDTCSVGTVIPKVMDHYYQEIQSSAEARMDKISLQDIIDDVQMYQEK